MKKAPREAQAGDTYPRLPIEELRLLLDHMISPFSYLRMVYDEAGEPVDYVFLGVNRAFEAETGLRRENILGKNVLSIFPNTEKYWIQFLGRVAKTGNPERFSSYAGALNSWYDTVAYSPKPDHVAMTVTNTTEAVQRRMKLQEKTLELNLSQNENYRLAHEDPVTRLPNRAGLSIVFAELAAHCDVSGGAFALAVMELDGFSELNATYGSLLGESLLRAVAAHLCQHLTADEQLFSLTGSVFALLMPGAPDERAVSERLDGLLDVVSQPLQMEDDYFRMTASCGVAMYPAHGGTEDILMMKANLARYNVRTIGGDAFRLYREQLGESLLRRTRMRSYLRKALENGEFELYFQPEVEAQTGQTIAYEALLRWHSPELGEVPPTDFIPVAEETRLIIPIGEWVLQKACEALKAMNAKASPPLRMAVNISAVQLLREGFLEFVLHTADEAGLLRGQLEIEITESVFVGREGENVDLLNRLHDEGMRISLDDFGTGYSSLSLMHELRLDSLKLDRRFIDRAESSELVDLIVQMAHTLGAEVVAEGVETEAQRIIIERTGCDIMQGYLYGRPEPLALALARNRR